MKLAPAIALTVFLTVVAAACGDAGGPVAAGQSETTAGFGTGLGGDDVISSDGSVIPGTGPSGQNEQAPGVGLRDPDDGGDGEPVVLIGYTDPEFGFTIGYPTSLDIVVGTDPDVADLLGVIDFTDGSPVPYFSVRVYENASGKGLEAWAQDLSIGTGWQAEVIDVAGGDALRMCSTTFQAPGCFVYLADGALVYQLAMNGSASQAMLDTLRLAG